MIDFKEAILDCILKNNNNDHTDNFDKERYGDHELSTKRSLIKRILFKNKISIDQQNNNIYKIFNLLIPNLSKLEQLYASLANDESRGLMILLLCYRMLGYKKIKLPLNNEFYFEELRKVGQLCDAGDSIDTNFLHFKLQRYNLRKLGKDMELYFTSSGIFVDFILEQYKYKSKDLEISAIADDVVIDAGGCWGDTALYFADKGGAGGKVISFEFIPDNIKIFERNMSLNPVLSKQIQLIKKPLWSEPGRKVYFKDNGPASRVSFDEFDGYTGTTETMTIDEVCKDLDKVSFIKMDIEGAEPYALEGAKNTIIKFRPKLAIAIYHSMDDFTNIPLWILNLNLGYRIYLGHYTIHEEETIIFAVAD